MTTAVEVRFLSEPSAFRDLDAHHLASLAYAFHAQRGGSPAFWTALVGRAVEIGTFCAADAGNLKAALAGAVGAPAVPVGSIGVVADEP